MKKFSFLKVASAAALATMVVGQANAQLSLGEECGCPPLASRTTVNLSSLLQANGELTNPTTVLTCNNLYRLDVLTYVQDGARLFIQAGTVIKAEFGEGTEAAAVVVSRGGKIFANGEEHCPIIFTAEADPLDGTYSVDIRGQWGGIIMLGKSPNNLLLADGGLAVGDGVGTIEGLVPGDSRNHYGGNDVADNSGVMRYVSIRHGGANIGADNEINGLTMGSVGNGTTLEYIEVIANVDDAFEFFGGSVDLKYGVAAYSGDDYYDYDQGYIGRNQFIVAIALGNSTVGDHGFEADGDDSNSGNMPFTDARIYNATVIGRGANRGVLAREGFGGRISNSIFCGFDTGVDLADEAGRPFDALQNFLNGSLVFTNNAFDGNNNLIRVNNGPAPANVVNLFANGGNSIMPGIIDFQNSIDVSTNVVTNAYNLVPAAGTASSPEVAPVDGFFTPANYKGAFKPGTTSPWTANWTLAALLETDNSLVACPTDINKDGQTDVNDFLELNSAFGTSCGN